MAAHSPYARTRGRGRNSSGSRSRLTLKLPAVTLYQIPTLHVHRCPLSTPASSRASANRADAARACGCCSLDALVNRYARDVRHVVLADVGQLLERVGKPVSRLLRTATPSTQPPCTGCDSLLLSFSLCLAVSLSPPPPPSPPLMGGLAELRRRAGVRTSRTDPRRPVRRTA